MVLVLAVPQAVDLVGNIHPLGNRRHSLAPPPPPLRLPTPLLAAAAAAKVQAMVDISLPHDGRQVVLIPFLHVREVVLTYSLMFSGGPRPGSDGEWTPSWRGAESPPAASAARASKSEAAAAAQASKSYAAAAAAATTWTSKFKFDAADSAAAPPPLGHPIPPPPAATGRTGEERRRTPHRPGCNHPRVQGHGR